jgi:glycosyltransferase involved in cell wall biosynthesis
MDIEDYKRGIPLKVLYISPSPPPKVPGTDGLFNEIGYLRKFFGGDMISLSPARSLPPLIPVSLYGMHQISAIKKYNKYVDIFHLFFPYMVNFRILRYFKKPVVYTIATGMDSKRSAPACTLVVSSAHEADILRSRGVSRVHVIRPGIDYSQIQVAPPQEPDTEFVLLAGSAPWDRRQFETKGFDLLLSALERLSQIRLICLWRGTLTREWSNRVRSLGLADRVEIIQEKVDISGVLSRCHAAIALSATSGHIKSFPNSLMEALAAGRPALISRSIPMSCYVEDTGCGKVIEELRLEELIDAIAGIIDEYSTFSRAALMAGRALSADGMIDDYRHLYQSVIE